MRLFLETRKSTLIRGLRFGAGWNWGKETSPVGFLESSTNAALLGIDI